MEAPWLGAMMATDGAHSAQLLLVSECPSDATLLARLIRTHSSNGLRVQCFDRFTSAIDYLAQKQADLVLLAPRESGVDTLDQVHQIHRLAPDALVVLVTDSDGKEPWRDSAQEWALECLPRDQISHGAEFVRMLTHLLERHRLFTRLEQQAQAIEQRERQMRTILETTHDAILVLDLTGLIRYANRASAALFRRPVDELTGTPLRQLISHHRNNEVDFVWPNDERGVAEMEAHDAVWDHGPATLVSLHDVTDRKRHEQMLERVNAELTQKHRAMEQFVFVATHDLKSPLVHLSMFADQIKEDAQAGRLEHLVEYATRIDTAATRMRRTIDDLLELSRIGQFVGDVSSVDVGQVVRDLIREQYEARFQADGIHFELQDHMPVIVADPTRIWQLFDNLIGNAMKHGMRETARRIRVGSRTTRRDVRLFVQDFGPGIAPVYQDRIFDLFHRISTDKEGTGIGLAIVKRIAEVHGGRTWVRSSPGHGATFWVAFPRQPAEHANTTHMNMEALR